MHCYGPKGGENGLHAHIEEDHIFVVLQGEAQFSGLNGPLPVLKKNQALMLPKGCFYSFSNEGTEPLVMIRFGAMDKGAPAAGSIRRASRSPAAASRPAPSRRCSSKASSSSSRRSSGGAYPLSENRYPLLRDMRLAANRAGARLGRRRRCANSCSTCALRALLTSALAPSSWRALHARPRSSAARHCLRRSRSRARACKRARECGLQGNVPSELSPH